MTFSKSHHFRLDRKISETTVPIIEKSKNSLIGFLGTLSLALGAYFLFVAGICSAPAEPSGKPGQATSLSEETPPVEVYATASDGTPLHWFVYTPSTPGPWPVVLVIHGGGFISGTPSSSPQSVVCAQDLAAAGYIAFSIEYRLAPPGALPGQVSDGRFPDQTDDVKLAVNAARADSRGNGQVGAVGGSGGGYHAAFAAATGTVGGDRVDVAVSLSGAYDLSDFSASPNIGASTEKVTNYVGVLTTDTEALRAASPAWVADAATSPLFMVNSLGDSMPYSQLPDMIRHLDALGLTNYQTLSLPGRDHSFAHWPAVKEQAMVFLAEGFAGVPPPPPLPPPGPGTNSKKLLNVSTRADAGLGENVMVGGFIVSGDSNKRVVLRALGPSLGEVGVSGVLADPMISLYDSGGTLIESNNDRLVLDGVVDPLLPPHPSESHLLAILPAGVYTAVVEGVKATTGVALVEVYDLEPGRSGLANISTRGDIGHATDVIIGGFIVGGAVPTQVIVRALGPSLASFGVSNPILDPALEIYDSDGNFVAANDNWRSSQAEEIEATLPPANDLEAAIVATLPPGSYTALVHDSNHATGVGLVEAYNLEL